MAQAETQSRSKVISKTAAMRRRRSNGGVATGNNGSSSQATTSQLTTAPLSSLPSQSAGVYPNPSTNQQNTIHSSGSSGSITILNSSQTQGNTSSNSNVSSGKPCHAARLALLCCQNAIRMGARTQLGLCPPGRARRELKSALRTKNRSSSASNKRGSASSISASSRRSSSGQSFVTQDVGGYFGLEKMLGSETLENLYPALEEDCLSNAHPFDAESDEEASSGDDDDLIDPQKLFFDLDAPQLQHNDIDDERKYVNLVEPLYTPIGDESVLANSMSGPMSGVGGLGKLPFNRRKIRYFDSITAHDTMTVRAYLNQETQRSKRREIMMLSRHLKRTQRMQRKKLKEVRGGSLGRLDSDDFKTNESEDQQLSMAGVSKFDGNMTPSLAAALVIESLEMNKLESIEGMAKCYDGIIAAGIALLETNNDPSTKISDDSSPKTGSATHGKRAQIIRALTPLLISSLEQPSGDVIIALAKLRRMCGTARYQRRFVQRVAPSLIRPPRGAMWCLKHQNDMEPILAAAELIFDCALDVFSKGWYDRGQSLLADTKRAETLNTVANQLKNLSSHPEGNLTFELSHGTSTWRSNKYKSGKDASKGTKEPLAEWEVIEVDRQIRMSISNIVSMDWSRVVVSKEAALSSASFHRARGSSKRPSVLLQPTSSGELNMSPKNTAPTPLSPLRQPILKSQPPLPAFGGETTDSSNTATLDSQRERSKSPVSFGTSGHSTPISPPPPHREIEGNLSADQFGQPSSASFSLSEQTPPRSPKPKSKEISADSNSGTSTTPSVPTSPKRNKVLTGKESISGTPEQSTSSPLPSYSQHTADRERAPLSPPPAAVASSSESGHHRPVSSTSSVSSAMSGISGATGSGSQPSHYRMLTSTAAERKRTVAACRALRAQITRFEDAFIQLHGRPPKGAAERAPLATTYAQYREWKRAIRADAACRIQALFRGARTRWILLRSNNKRISKVVMTRAGRRTFRLQNNPSQGQTSMLDELSIPTDIGDPRQESALSNNMRNNATVDVQANQSLAPQWGDQVMRRRSGSNDFSSNSHIPRPTASQGTPSRGSTDLSSLSLPELQAQKRELKQQLKQYDMSFARRHGRMPVKAEKEPIRHLYERYNALKGHISEMEQEGRRSASPNTSPLPASSSPLGPQRIAVSPIGSDSDESTGRRTSSSSRRNTSGSAMPGQDLQTLKAEKGRLHQMLRSFERDFYRENQRQVQSFADIRPVAAQYRRYKEIKKAIAALQRGDR